MFIEIVAVSPHGNRERRLFSHVNEARAWAYSKAKDAWDVSWRWCGLDHPYDPDDDNCIPETI